MTGIRHEGTKVLRTIRSFMPRSKWLDVFGGAVPFAIVVAIGAAAVWLLLSEGLQPADRSQIHFRHARNLTLHGRLSFNLNGQPVLATEAPAFVALLSACSALFRTSRIDQTALFLNAFFLFVIVVISYLIAKDIFAAVIPAVFAAFLMSFHSVSIAVFAQGFEQAMLLSVMLCAFYLLSKRRFTPGLLLASLTPLIALEGIVAIVLVVAFLFLSRNRKPVYFALLLLAPFLWIIFSAHFYESVIPQPVVARYGWQLLTYPYQEVWYSWLERVIGLFYGAAGDFVVLHRVLFNGSFSNADFGFFAYLRLLLAISGFAFWLKSARKSVLYFFFPLLFILVNPYLGTAYSSVVSCISFAILIYFFACCHAWRQLLSSKSLAPNNIVLVAGYSILFILFQTGSRYELNPWGDPILSAVEPRGSKYATSARQRYNSYKRAAEYLKRRGAADKLVLTSDADFFGYAYPGEIFDASGYCTPSAIRYYPPVYSDLYDRSGWRFSRTGTIPSRMMYGIKPDYVVASEATLRHLLEPDSAFWREYTHLTRSGLVWGSWLSIYQKRE